MVGNYCLDRWCVSEAGRLRDAIFQASDLKSEDGNSVIYCRTWKSKVLEEVNEVFKD